MMPRRLRLALLLVLIIGTLAILAIINPSREEQDIVQQRLDDALLPLGPDYTISQTIHSEHAGLTAVIVTLVRYERAVQLPAEARLLFRLERLDGSSEPVTVAIPVSGLVHNQQLRFDFPEMTDSYQTDYRITLSTDQDYGLSVWRTLSDAYAGGQAYVNGRQQPGDICFTTIYNYHLSDVLNDLVIQIRRWAPALPGLLAMLALPGAALAPWLLPKRRLRWPFLSGYVIVLSLASWPLLFLWASVPRYSLEGWPTWFVLIAAGGIAIVGWIRRGMQLRGASAEAADGSGVFLLLVLVLSLATRLLQIRNLVVPNWVDSVHHTLLTQLLADTGFVPGSYEPYMPVNNLHYHFGFHANAAVLEWLSPLDSSQAVLLLGQVIGAMAPLAIYLLTCTLTGSQWAGSGAALVAGLICYMPAYYASWGRYTHLLGLVMLCLVGCAFDNLFFQAEIGKMRWRQVLLCGGLLAGLALCHYRALIFAGLLIIVLLIYAFLASRARNWQPMLASLALVLGFCAILCAPWIYRLATLVLPNVGTTYGGWEAVEGYNAFPMQLLKGTLNAVLLAASAGSLLWAVIRRRWVLVCIGIWAGLGLLAANLHILGLFDLWLLPNSAVVISFWLPVSLLCGWLAADLAKWLSNACYWAVTRLFKRQPNIHHWEDAGRWIGAVLFCAVAVWGSWRMVDIINPVTVQVSKEDLAAMEWIKQNTPPEARFLVNTRVWSGELHVGSDAGWWLPLLAGRQASMPCILHTQGTGSFAREVRDLAVTVESSTFVDEPALVAALAAGGITHVYIGSAGGILTPARLDASRHYELLYCYGPTRVYRFIPNPD